MIVKRYAIIGGRPPKNPTSEEQKYYENILKAVQTYVEELPLDCVVISGGANGVDKLAIAIARQRGINTVEHLPDYQNYPGSIAPLVRNKLIVDDCDILVAFPTHWSTGTWHAINLAKQQQKSIDIHTPTQDEH